MFKWNLSFKMTWLSLVKNHKLHVLLMVMDFVYLCFLQISQKEKELILILNTVIVLQGWILVLRPNIVRATSFLNFFNEFYFFNKMSVIKANQ